MIITSNFQFDNTTSHRFGLIIGSIGDTGVQNIKTYGNIEIATDRAMNKTEPFYYRSKIVDHLEFPMTIINKHQQFYESWEVQIIQSWLFGRRDPHLLTIFDPDKMNESYECWLIDPEVIKVDNKPIGWSFTVKCTSSYSITDIKTEVFECTQDITDARYWNHSNIEDYLYPEMNIQLASDSTGIKIENESDGNRVFQLTGLRSGENIYVDNNLGYLVTVSGDKILKNFNLNYFRVVDGLNKLKITGKGVITIRTRFKKAVGGF